MIIAAIDPGVTTGFAYIDTLSSSSDFISPSSYHLTTFTDVNDLIDCIKEIAPDLIVIEDFNTSGTLNRERKITIMVIGAVLASQRWLDRPAILHVPQHRLAYLKQAREMFPKAIIHSIDALAHLLCAIDNKEYVTKKS